MPQNTAQQEQVLYQPDGMMVYIHQYALRYYPSMGHPCHYHEDIEFLYAQSGHITYSINGQLVRIQEGEGIFVNANLLHYGFSEDGTDCEFLVMLLNPLILSSLPAMDQKYLRPLTENRNFPYQILKPEVPWQKRILEGIEAIFEINYQQEPGYGLLQQRYFFEIWYHLFHNMPQHPDGEKQYDPKLYALRKMICFVQERLGEKVMLEDIAAVGNLCPSACCKLFQKYLHQSPVAFLNACRLSRACELLRQKDLSITEVAYKLGFSGASYFSEQFKKQYGCTPRQYRNRF